MHFVMLFVLCCIKPPNATTFGLLLSGSAKIQVLLQLVGIFVFSNASLGINWNLQCYGKHEFTFVNKNLLIHQIQ